MVLNIMAYDRPEIEMLTAELGYIPVIDIYTKQSVLSHTGRKRERRKIEGWATKTDFDSLETDYIEMTKKSITFFDGTSITGILEALEGDRKKGTTLIFYSATFLEA